MCVIVYAQSASGNLAVKSHSINADKFRAELKRLGVGQSAFAAAAEMPLRTVQSWALGERSIPPTAGALIEKVERSMKKDKFALILDKLPEKKLEVLLEVARNFAGQNKKIKLLEERTGELCADVSKLRSEIERLNGLCDFQGKKIDAYAKDNKRRAESVVPFND
jgi:DNA-binding transcriptional regulator YiaG